MNSLYLKQSDQERAEDVDIPRWANSLQEFTMKMKAALESEHSSLHLHSWIDHVWGINQRNPDIENTFADLCYSNSNLVTGFLTEREGRLGKKKSNDIQSYWKKDLNLKMGKKMKFQAMDLQMAQYGRVPKILFKYAHPKIKIKSTTNK